MKELALVYSGGTDSTCVAALKAGEYERIHLLTYREYGTRGAPSPVCNVEKLRAKFGPDKFVHRLLDIDHLLREISRDRYPSYLARHGFFMLSSCGFSSLSWHTRTLIYCLEHGISTVADGLTRELPHFPGHMDAVVDAFGELYAEFGVNYVNPVRDWPAPADPRFLDRLIVDRHHELAHTLEGFSEDPRTEGRSTEVPGTTGWYLYEQGLMPHPNVKGTDMDHSMQHACYPFVLFNIFAFWYYLSWHDYGQYERRMSALFREKIADVKSWVSAYRKDGPLSRLGALLEPH